MKKPEPVPATLALSGAALPPLFQTLFMQFAVAIVFAVGLRMLMNLWLGAAVPGAHPPRASHPPQVASAPADVAAIRKELLTLQRLVGAQEQLFNAERAASAASAAAAAASAAAAAVLRLQATGPPPPPPPPEQTVWSETSIGRLASSMRALSSEVDGGPLPTPPASPDARHASGAPRHSAEGALAAVEESLERLTARGAEVERAWAALHSERASLERAAAALRRALSPSRPAGQPAGSQRGGERRGADAASATSAAAAEPRRPRGAGDDAAPATAKAVPRRKPVRRSPDDWEKEWEEEDAHEKLVESTAGQLNSEVERLLRLFAAPPTAAKPSKGKGQPATNPASGLPTGDIKPAAAAAGTHQAHSLSKPQQPTLTDTEGDFEVEEVD